MAFNKNFVVKNGVEIATDLIYATNDLDKVGLGTTVPTSKLDVIGGITAYGDIRANGGALKGASSNITGIATVTSHFNVGSNGNALKVVVGSSSSVGINTNKPAYPLDVRAGASIGQTAAHFYGDLVVTGNLSGNSFDGAVSLGSTLSVTDLNITGILTAKDKEVYTQFDVINNGSAAYQYQSTGIGFTVNKDDPAIFLIRGKQYRFNINATGYPFYIKTLPTTGTGNRFDRGVQNNGAQVGIITFRVPFDAPRTLYYQASNQAGMGATIYVLKEADPLPTGLSTIQTTVQYLNVTGFATAANLRVTGFTTVSNLNTGNLNVAGIVTFSNNVNFTQSASFKDSDTLDFGTGNDLRIYHDGTSNIIANQTGADLEINLGSNSNSIFTVKNQTETLARFYRDALVDGRVELYYDDSKKFETIGSGVTVTGTAFANQLNVSGVSTFDGNVRLGDNDTLYLGDGNDLAIYHNGSNSYIQDVGTGVLRIEGSDIVYKGASHTFENSLSNETLATFTQDGSADLYFNNSKKFATIGSGVTVTGTTFSNQLNVSGVSTFFNDLKVGTTVTVRRSNGNASFSGIVTATKFVGDGSGLTGAGATVANDTSTNSTFYPLFTTITTGTVTGTKVSTTKLTFNPSTGTLTATDLNSSSDSSLKENIETIENALSTTNNLRGVKFNWKEDGRPSYGVIAQEIEKVLPELVNDAEHKTVNYNGIIGVLIEAVKELSDRVEMLEEKLYK